MAAFRHTKNLLTIGDVSFKLDQPGKCTYPLKEGNLVLNLSLQRNAEFLVKSVDGSKRIVEKLQGSAVLHTFTFGVDCVLETESSPSTIRKELLRIFLELGVQGASSSSTIFTMVFWAMRATTRACVMKCKTSYLKVEVEYMKTYLYDEQEAIAMVTRESFDEEEETGCNGLVPASKSAINGLEEVKLHNNNSGGGGNRGGSNCAVCFDEMEVGLEVTRMPCLHVFHRSCIVHWLEINHVCPICRFEMPV